MGGRDTHYHKDTLHPTHQNLPFKLTQSCQLWWAHHQKRHWQENPQQNRLQDNTKCTLNPLYTMIVSHRELDQLWISLLRFLQEKQETQHSSMSIAFFNFAWWSGVTLLNIAYNTFKAKWLNTGTQYCVSVLIWRTSSLLSKSAILAIALCFSSATQDTPLFH